MLYEVCAFTHGQHGRGQQPPGEELQEDHDHGMSHCGSASSVLQRAETNVNPTSMLRLTPPTCSDRWSAAGVVFKNKRL